MVYKSFSARDGFRLIRSFAPIGILDFAGSLRQKPWQVTLRSKRRLNWPVFALRRNIRQFRLTPVLHFQPFVRFVFSILPPSSGEASSLVRNA